MNRERSANALNQLHALAEQIRNSQRFGQPLPVGTTAKWEEELERIEEEIRTGTGIRDGVDPAKTSRLVKDFSVETEYW